MNFSQHGLAREPVSLFKAYRCFLLANLLAFWLAVPVLAQNFYHVTDLGDLPGGTDASAARGINDNGQVVGESNSANGIRAFLWSSGRGMLDLGVLPGGTGSGAHDINNSGHVVGDISGDTGSHAFLWSSAGGMLALADLPGGADWTSALGINNNGQVVGAGNSIGGGYVWTSTGGMMALGDLPGGENYSHATAINDNGQVVGTSGAATGNNAFLWTPGVGMQDLGVLPGGASSDATAINASGQVAGWSSATGGNHAFLWTRNGGMQNLGDLPGGGDFSIAEGINDSGQVVGWSEAASGTPTRTPYSAFVWTSAGGMRDLRDSIDASGAAWELSAATAINNRGQIVGYGFNPSGAEHAFLLTPVPDPIVLGSTKFNDPPLGAGTFQPGPAVQELGFVTTTTPSGGVNPLAGVAVGPEGSDPRVLTHRSINATTTFDAVDLKNFDDAFVSLRLQIANTTYEASDRVQAYVTNGAQTIDLVNLSGASALNDLAGDGFLRFWALIPNDWIQASLVITSSSNSSQAAERYDFDSIEVRGVAVVPEPGTRGLALAALVATVFARRARRYAAEVVKRKARALVITLAKVPRLLGPVVALAALGATASATTYSFTNIIDSSVPAPTGNYINIGDAAISGNRVAFKASYDPGYMGIIDGIFTSTGGPRTLIARYLSDAPPRTGYELGGGTFTILGRPAIEGSAVNFDAEVFHSDSFTYAYGVFRGSGVVSQGRPFVSTVVSQRQAPQFTQNQNTADVLISDGYLSYRSSSSNTVAPNTIRLVNPERTSNIPIVGVGSGAPGGGVFSSIDANYDLSSGTVAFRGIVGTQDGIYIGAGGPLTSIAGKGDLTPSGSFFDAVLDPSISGDTVAFLGTFAGGSGIFTGNGTALSTVVLAGDSAPGGQLFSGFSVPTIAYSTLAFRGEYSDGSGIFTKRGGEVSKVVGIGDALFGSTVTSFSFSDLGLDPTGSGNLAFTYGLADGRSGIAMANPGVGLPTIYQDALATVPVPDSVGIVWVPAPDFAGRNLTGAWLYAADLKNANAQNVNLSNSVLRNANLTNANLTGANLTGANLEATELSGANLSGAQLRNAQVRRIFITQENCSLFGCSPTYLGFGGIRPSQLYTTANYRDRDLSNISFEGNNFTNVNLAGQDLTNTDLHGAVLTGANLTGARVNGTSFGRFNLTFACASLGKGAQNGGCRDVTSTFGTGVTLDQLYTTASFLAGDLTDLDVAGNNMEGGDFAGQVLSNAVFLGANLTNADFSHARITNVLFRRANLTAANLSNADARGASFTDAVLTDAIWSNFIAADGHVDGLNVPNGYELFVRDYGDATRGLEPIPITVDQQFAIETNGTLSVMFDADTWDSTISFAAGIPVTLDGTLELTFSAGVDMAGQVGRTHKLFDWTGVAPTGVFNVASSLRWDLSNLYTTGEVTLLSAFSPGDANGDGQVNRADVAIFVGSFGTAEGAQWSDGDFDGNGRVDLLDLSMLKSNLGVGSPPAAPVPEPSAAMLIAATCVFLFVVWGRPDVLIPRTPAAKAPRLRCTRLKRFAATLLLFAAVSTPAAASRLRVLHSFSGADGGGPLAEVAIDGSTLYGTTGYGGAHAVGTLYKVNTDGTGFQILHNFTTGYQSGYNPVPAVVVNDGVIYGSTNGGDNASDATVYKLNTDGTGFRVLHHFPDGLTGPGDPSRLTLSGATLYGTTTGICCVGHSSGTVFKLNTDGTGFHYVHTFAGNPVPLGGVALGGSTLYGTTREGGASNYGTIFKVNTDGTGFQSFSMPTDERAGTPQSGVILDGTALYGTSHVVGGDFFTFGSVFRLGTDGSGFEFIHRFPSDQLVDGTYPVSGLTRVGSKLFGATATGGHNGAGIIYSLNADGSDYRVLHRFRYEPDNVYGPWGKLTRQGGVLYGTTPQGGADPSQLGTVFAFSIPQDVAKTRFDEPPVGAANYAPVAGAEEWGFATTQNSTGGASSFAGVAIVDNRRVLTHSSTHATTRFSTLDLSPFTDIEISVDIQVANTTYETGDFLRIYVTDGIESVDLFDADGAGSQGLDALAGLGFQTYSATIPDKWTTAWLMIESYSNSSQAAERYDFDNIFFMGVPEPIPEPSTQVLAALAVALLAFLRLFR